MSRAAAARRLAVAAAYGGGGVGLLAAGMLRLVREALGEEAADPTAPPVAGGAL